MAAPVRILLLDDEATLLRLMETYLTKLGYAVDSCMTGKDALRKFDEAADEFGVLVADLTLPDISGETVAAQMAERNPRLRVLLCSGYPFQLESLPAEIRGRFAVLQKPFLPNMLAGSIEKLLAKRTSSP
jgi:DNA-binding NtrC family response regulator